MAWFRRILGFLSLPEHFARLYYYPDILRHYYIIIPAPSFVMFMDGLTVAFCFSQISEVVRLRLLSLVLPGREPPSPDGRHPDLSFLAVRGVYRWSISCRLFL